MEGFAIAVEPLDSKTSTEIRRIRISAGEEVLTRLVRNGSEHDDALKAPPASLAFWLVDNWWRIHFEPVPANGPDASWRLAHEVSSIGGGHVWPRVVLWGEGPRRGIAVHPEPLPAPVQFLAHGIRYVAGCDVEASADAFIRQMLADAVEDHEALRAEYGALCDERANKDSRTWRMVEAMLGFDVDEAPAQLMGELDDLMVQYGEESLEEAVLAMPGDGAATALRSTVESTRTSGLRIEMPVPPDAVAFDRNPHTAPWEAAEQAAASLRAELSLVGPVLNRRLGDVFSVAPRALRQQVGPPLPYGLRMREETGDGNRISLGTFRSQARRFELCRSVGDMVWSRNDGLGPVSRAMSARQKFQRAFAQSFLCPYQELLDYCGPEPGQDDVAAAASRFHVSERTIWTVLVNKKRIERNEFVEAVGLS